MNEKQKAIELAYGNRYNNLKEFINEDGVFIGDTDLITNVEFDEWNFIVNAKPLIGGKLIAGSRPKSLTGIETNNGWISINSESDLPKDNLDYHVMVDGYDYYILSRLISIRVLNCSKGGEITHYQPIIKPEKPIY